VTLSPRVALVTGGSRGLGLAIAHALGGQGARVALVARASGELDGAVRELSAAGIECRADAADVTVADQVERAVANTVQAWGRLDILVLNAGTWKAASIDDTTEELWDQLVDLNLKGAFLALKYAVPHLRARQGATVIGISSIGAWAGSAKSSAYAASKWGLRGLLESAALELKPDRVRVSLVHPHNMNSEGRAIAPGTKERDQRLETSEVASLVAWICAAPDHVSVGNVTIWPLASGLRSF
jgi:NAD(P)-dependent dehydrogenase (short-subunit alcohol dehydrogenase family)